MPSEPFFTFHGMIGDLVIIHYAGKVYEDLGILMGECEEQLCSWMVLVDGSIHRLHQDRLEIISEISLDSSAKD